jgi:SH3-like domain-containing protein
LILDGDVQAALRDDVSTGERVLGTASLLLALALLGVGLPSAAHTVWSPRYHAILGLQDLAHDKLDDALAHARAATRLAENDGAARIVLGRVTHDPALIADGLMHFDADPLDAFESATRALALIDDDTAEYSDPETVAALCDAALAQAGTTPQPILKNDCAWLRLKSANVHVHDAKLGLALAQQAVDESAGRVPTIVQTLSEARAQNGDLAGAITLVQGLLDTKQTTGMSVPWLHSELERLQRLQEAEKKAAAAAALVPPVVVPAPVDAAAADAAKPVDAGTVDAGTSP